MSNVKKSVAIGYLLVALSVWAIFTGSFYRGEMPLWILSGLAHEAMKPRSGTADLILTGVLYLVYYSSLFVLPYAVLDMLLHNSPPNLKRYAREIAAASATWCALTFLLYHEALFTIVRVMSTDSISEWLGLLWIASSAFVFYLWWEYARRSAEKAV